MFADSAQSITMDLPPAPPNGGNGIGGSNGSHGGGKRPNVYVELMNRLREDVPAIKTAAQLISRIDSDLERCPDQEEKLSYLHAVVVEIEIHEQRFGPEALLNVVHHAAGHVDGLTKDWVPPGSRRDRASYLDEVLRPFFRLGSEMERRLLDADKLTGELKERIADINMVVGVKGLYSRYYMSRSREPLLLAKTIFILQDVVRRYKIAVRLDKARAVTDLLEQVRAQSGLPEDYIQWAILQVSEVIEQHTKAAEQWKDEKDILEEMLNNISACWLSMINGIYLFAPSVFRMLAKAFEGYGFEEPSSRYAGLATWSEGMAKRLGLIEV